MRYAKQWPRNLKTSLSGSSGLGKSRFKKTARRINIINLQEYQFNLYCSNGKRWKDIWFHWFRSIKMWQSDDIDATSFGFQEFLNALTRTSQRFSRYTNKAWALTLCNHHKVTKIGLRESNNHQNMKDKRGQIWIELDFDNNNNRVNYWTKHYPDDNKKSQWRKLLVKKSQWKNFSQIHRQEKILYYLWDYKLCVIC